MSVVGLGEFLRGVVQRADDWYSTAIGLGGSADKVASIQFRSAGVLDDGTLDALFHGDPIARRIVELLPKEALREGFRVTVGQTDEEEPEGLEESKNARARADAFPPPKPAEGQGGPTGQPAHASGPPPVATEKLAKAKAEKIRQKLLARQAEAEARQATAQIGTDVLQYLRDRKGHEALQEAWIWGRLFGGGLVLVGADDGSKDLAKPLAEDGIKTLRYLQVIDCRYVSIERRIADTNSPHFGEPEIYTISPQVLVAVPEPTRRVHASRVIRFPGMLTSTHYQAVKGGWDLSVLDLMWPFLQAFNSDWAAVHQGMTDWSQAILKIKDLAMLVASGQKEVLEERAALMERTSSVTRAKLLDIEEAYEILKRDFSGVPDVLQEVQSIFSAGLGYPMSWFFGRSPAGMNATGEADDRIVRDLVKAEWTSVLRERAERLVKLVFLAKDGPTSGKEPEEWDVVPNQLRQPTPKESAELQKFTAEADKIRIDSGVLSAQAVLRGRYKAEGYQTDLDVDADEVLDELAEQQIEEQEAQAEIAKATAEERENMSAEEKAAADEQKAADLDLDARMKARKAAKAMP